MTAAPKLRLITIAPSHYCEKARWALDRVGARYREEPHLPLFHFLATVRPGRKSRTVPILVTPHGELTDSTEILRHLDGWVIERERLYPEAFRTDVEELEELFDAELGPATRRWGYCWLLDHPAAFAAMFAGTGPRAERLAFRAAAPVVKRALRRAFKVSEKAKARSLQRIQAVFAQVDARLAGGKRFLVGDRFTAADLTLASLAGPVLGPDGNRAQTPPRHLLPPEMLAQIDALRATPTGEHVLRIFKEERGRVVAPSNRSD
jgi:glutathione S-transferase